MKKDSVQKEEFSFSSVMNTIKQYARKFWNGFLVKITDLKDRFFKLNSETQRYIAAAVIGGIALLLLIFALIISISSCSSKKANEASSEKEMLIYPQPSPVPESFSVAELGPTEEWEDGSVPEPDEPEEEPAFQLKKHDKSDEVIALQKALISLGYLEIDEPTDYFGSSTEYAVKLFQRQHGLEQDGVAGAMTLSLLYSDDAQKYTLKEGAEGRDVKMLQEQLYDLGYLSSSEIDSVYGEVTTAAVIAFQKRNGLSADGKAGEKTLEKLYSDDAKMSKEKEAEEKAAEEAAKKKEKEAAAAAKESKEAEEAQSAKERRIEKFIKAAKSKIGCEYVLGDRGPDTFDCSGFVYWCLRQAGVSTTRLNAAGYSRKSSWKEITSYSNVQKGDILFFRSDDSSSVSHTGIYIGSGMMIDASSGNGKVVKRAVSSYWKRNFVNARRPW